MNIKHIVCDAQNKEYYFAVMHTDSHHKNTKEY